MAIQLNTFKLSPVFITGSEVEQTSSFQVFSQMVSDLICERLGVNKVDDINYQTNDVERLFKKSTDRIICSIIVPQLAPSIQLKGLGLSNKKIYEELHKIVIQLLCSRPPSLIIIDDAQWIDKKSWVLIQDILLQCRQMRGDGPSLHKFMHVIMVVTRPPVSDKDTISTFLSWLKENEASNSIEQCMYMNISDMSEDSITSIISEELGSKALTTIDPAVAEIVINAASGNPSHAKIFVSWAKEKKIIVQDNDGVWKLKNSAVEINFPESMNAVILSRVDHLDYELSETLKVASCIGYRFYVEMLAHAMDCELDVLEPVLETLEKKEFIDEDNNVIGGKCYKYKEHAVFGSIKTLLMGSQKIVIHSKILHFLEFTGSYDHSLLAHHAEQCGKHGEAAMHFEQATAKSLDSYDYGSAQQFLVKAIQLREFDMDKTSKDADGPKREQDMKDTVIRLLILKRQLGNILRQMARYDESEKVLLECLALFESKADAKRDWYFKKDALSTIGVLFKEQGEYEKAEARLSEMLAIAKEHLESTDLELAHCLSQYAELLRKQQKIDESMALHQEALDICLHNYENHASPKHKRSQLKRRYSLSNFEIEGSKMEVQLSDCQTCIGCCLASKKMPKEAGMRHQEALKFREKHLSPMHPLLSESLNYVGEAMLNQQQPSKALPYFIRALGIRKVAFGPGHPAVAHVLGLLACALRALGRFEEAHIRFVECIVICERVFKPTHPNLIPNLMNFGRLLILEQNWVEADEVFRRALSIHKGAGR